MDPKITILKMVAMGLVCGLASNVVRWIWRL